VEIAERYADKLATAAELSTAWENAWRAHEEREYTDNQARVAADVACRTMRGAIIVEILHASQGRDKAEQAAGRAAQADLLREILGNPFRRVALERAWRTPGVLQIARGIYDDLQFSETPILADALEDTGCTTPELLDHLRSGAEHVRGCWAVDLVLGKSCRRFKLKGSSGTSSWF
jgi:hypothetical protein